MKKQLGWRESQKRKQIAKRAGVIRWLKWSEGKSKEEISNLNSRIIWLNSLDYSYSLNNTIKNLRSKIDKSNTVILISEESLANIS